MCGYQYRRWGGGEKPRKEVTNSDSVPLTCLNMKVYILLCCSCLCAPQGEISTCLPPRPSEQIPTVPVYTGWCKLINLIGSKTIKPQITYFFPITRDLKEILTEGYWFFKLYTCILIDIEIGGFLAEFGGKSSPPPIHQEGRNWRIRYFFVQTGVETQDRNCRVI